MQCEAVTARSASMSGKAFAAKHALLQILLGACVHLKRDENLRRSAVRRNLFGAQFASFELQCVTCAPAYHGADVGCPIDGRALVGLALTGDGAARRRSENYTLASRGEY